MRKYLILLSVAIVLAGVAIYQHMNSGAEADAGGSKAASGPGLIAGSSAAGSADVNPKPGYTAPRLELTDLNEKPVEVAGKRDKLLIVNFWASWCYPCEMEAPDLESLSKKYDGKLDLYGINATNYDQERQARAFVDQQKLTFPILMDRKGKAVEAYKVSSFPTSLIIDSNGIVRERITGIIKKGEWEQLIDKWLKAEGEPKKAA
ncbi:TlpA family protein disulfide reductase [Paenibacillus humicola]|uniref:TlpA family protein disulfide reductase n=1 Tax=Paenibacillus humicola TaxID=3110540 RepID=UPI00237A6A10|nr:TlpA disulfide reductase family protein [Paenibacillus humicola]